MTLTNPAKVKDSVALWEVLVKKFHVSFIGLVTLFVWIAIFTTQAHANDCQQAHKKIQAHFKKEKALRDHAVVFTQMDTLSHTQFELAHLGIERELLVLAKKGILHQCDFSSLASAGLQLHVSEDGQFHIYNWITDYEIPESLIYAAVIYAPSKQANFPPAYFSVNSFGEFSQLITIPKPIEASDKNDADFPIYAVVTRHFLRGTHRIHCEPILSLYYVKQNKNGRSIAEKMFRFLDTQGNPIKAPYRHMEGCDSDNPYTEEKLDYQFHYKEFLQILGFHIPERVGYVKDSLSMMYKFIPYRFRFNGTDFVQMKLDPSVTD